MAILVTKFRLKLWPLLLILCFLLTACSRPFFYPDKYIRLTPDKLGINYQDISLTTKDGTILHAWHLLPETKAKGVILFLHGNAENISTHIHNVSWLHEAGYEILLLDYRGYGRSEGRPTLPEVFQDIDSAAHWLSNRSHVKEIPAYWIGQSLGASLSAYYLSHNKVEKLKAVILDAPFASYQNIGREKFSEFWLTWPLQYPLSWLIDNRYSPNKAAHKWPKLPLLVFSSSKDRVVPNHHTLKLIDQLQTPDWKIEHIDTQDRHTGTYNHSAYRKKTLAFFEQNSGL